MIARQNRDRQNQECQNPDSGIAMGARDTSLPFDPITFLFAAFFPSPTAGWLQHYTSNIYYKLGPNAVEIAPEKRHYLYS